MNLVECRVLNVLSKKETDINGTPWIIYRVKAVAWGHLSVCTLSYPKAEAPEVKVGFKFLA